MFELKQLRVHPKWQAMLRAAGLLNIESVVEREFDWFEAPNRRRGGWSGVMPISRRNSSPPHKKGSSVKCGVRQRFEDFRCSRKTTRLKEMD